MPFLPSNYEAPAEGSRYYKLKKGENKFRVLGSAIVGNEYWTEKDGKRHPVRKRVGQAIMTQELEGGDGNGVKHFWAFPVWDAADGQVKIFEITQKGIRKDLQKILDDSDWSDPLLYDIVIHREGDGLDTEYSVSTKLPKALTAAQEKVWKDIQTNGFSLDELFSAGDPFAPTHTATPAEINIDDIDI